MVDVFDDAFRRLEEAKQRSSRCLIAYSGGKDSRVIAEMACRVFDHVDAMFMYCVHGLECVEAELDFGRRRWGFEIRQYPHWAVAGYLNGGSYCDPYAHGEIEALRLDDIYEMARQDAKVPFIATGAKNADSMWRKRQLGTWGKREDMLYPIQFWNKLHVLSFLKANDIPLPDSSGKAATGIDLSTPSLLWLHDSHPKDFRKLAETFPFVWAVVRRRDWYGVK